MQEKKSTRGGAREGSGRKVLPPEAVMIPVTVKMRPDQRDKLSRLGGAPWLRDRIDRAKIKE